MPRLYELLTRNRQLELAVRTKSPAQMAQTFAAYAGQFYDRSAFDALARQVADLYAADSPDQADTFRTRLNQRLCDRYHKPVAWELSQNSKEDTYG